MATPKDIMDMYLHLRETNQTIPDEALEYMKSVCLESLDETHHSFTSIAQPTKVDDIDMVGVWTDGISLISDNGRVCEYPLKQGKKYKVSVVEIDY